MEEILLGALASLSGKEALAAANEVDDLVAVAGCYLSGNPRTAGQNFEVALNGNAFGADTEVLQKPGHIEPIRNFAQFAVHCYFHIGDCHAFRRAAELRQPRLAPHSDLGLQPVAQLVASRGSARTYHKLATFRAKFGHWKCQ